jgi:hypothetical protein
MDTGSTCLGNNMCLWFELDGTTGNIRLHARNIRKALVEGNVHVVKTMLSSCDAPKLFCAIHRYFHCPIMLYAARAWCNPDTAVSPESMQAILEALEKAGAAINESDNTGFLNPIKTAVTDRNLPLCKILLRLGAEPAHTPDRESKFQSALTDAVFEGPEYVALLLQYTTKITARDEFLDGQFSALWRTVRQAHESLHLFMDWYEESEQQFPLEEALTMCFQRRLEESAMTIVQRHVLKLSAHHIITYFHSAASGGLVNVMLFLIEQQPEVLQSGWLVNNDIPSALQFEEHQDFVAWLRDVSSHPLPLQLICRLNILRQLRSRPEHSIGELPLPSLLKDFLKEEKVFATFPSRH